MSRPPKGSDIPLKQHLLQVYRQTGRKPQALAEQADPPEELFYLIHWMGRLGSPVTYAELHHFSTLTGIGLSRWEIDALIQLDHIRNR